METDENGNYATAGQNGMACKGVSASELISDQWLAANIHKMDRRDMIYTILSIRTHLIKLMRIVSEFTQNDLLENDNGFTYRLSEEEE